MTLACNYPTIFWNTANLIVDSAGIEENPADIDQDEVAENIEEVEAEKDEEEDIEDNDIKEKVKRVKKTIDYGKIAKAIGKFKSYGITILPPDINASSFTFLPNVEQNSITYGLRGISGISPDIIKQIIQGRPYTSLQNFMSKNKLSKPKIVSLIKSGAFDNVEHKPRQEIMNDYLSSIADKKTLLNLRNMSMLITQQIIPEEMDFYRKLFLFNKFLKDNISGAYYLLNDAAVNFIDKYFSIDLISDGQKIVQKLWDKTYSKAMDPMRQYLKDNQEELLNKLNQSLAQEVINKYGSGTISKWEMDSLSFYYHNHELAAAERLYDNFFEMSDEPIIDKVFESKDGKEIKMFQLKHIIGTVIDKNKLKNTISLLTPQGVVVVKIYKNQYAIYDKRVSEIGDDGKKHVIEEGWFKKGTLLMIQGIRRGDNFIPKKYKSSPYPIISKIINIDDSGNLELQYERMEVDA